MLNADVIIFLKFILQYVAFIVLPFSSLVGAV